MREVAMPSDQTTRPLAIVTGASTGIGYELALCCARNGFDRVVAADESAIHQDFAEVRHVVDTNVTGTIYLIQKVGREMRRRGQGRILITGSIAGFMPGTYQAVYNATKAFLDSFSFALRHEVKDQGITITCLMPGATETEFFERADMLDTKVGTSKKDDPAMVAETGFKAMMRGDGDVVTGWHNKLQTAIASVTPAGMLAEQHRKMAEPGSARG
jgi:short-subunit dehydrogenase